MATINISADASQALGEFRALSQEMSNLKSAAGGALSIGGGAFGALGDASAADPMASVRQIFAKQQLDGALGSYSSLSALKDRDWGGLKDKRELEKLNGGFSALTDAMDRLREAMSGDDAGAAMSKAADLQTAASALREDWNAAKEKEKSGGIEKWFGAREVSQAVSQAVQTVLDIRVRRADKSGEVGLMSSGDFLGADISLKGRSADEKSAWGGLGGSVAGAGITAAIAAIPGVGPAIAAIAAPIVMSVSSLIGKNVAQGDKEAMARENTFRSLVQGYAQSAPAAVDLAAKYGAENVGAFREGAAYRAARQGYSGEEGVALAADLSKYGLSAAQGILGADQILKAQRATGADRSALAGVFGEFAKFGDFGAIENARKGQNASGLENGRYSEFLAAMLRVMEDGVSKGFVKSSGKVAKELSAVAALGGGLEQWKGEAGAEKLSAMNAGVAALGNLGDSTAVIGYSAALRKVANDKGFGLGVLKDAGIVGGGLREKTLERLGLGGGAILDERAAMQMILSGGVGAELAPTLIDAFGAAEGGNFSAIIDRMKGAFGLNDIAAGQLYFGYQDLLTKGGGKFDAAEFKKIFDRAKGTEDAKQSPELQYLKDTQLAVEAMKNQFEKEEFYKFVKDGLAGDIYSKFAADLKSMGFGKTEKVVERIVEKTTVVQQSVPAAAQKARPQTYNERKDEKNAGASAATGSNGYADISAAAKAAMAGGAKSANFGNAAQRKSALEKNRAIFSNTGLFSRNASGEFFDAMTEGQAAALYDIIGGRTDYITDYKLKEWDDKDFFVPRKKGGYYTFDSNRSGGIDDGDAKFKTMAEMIDAMIKAMQDLTAAVGENNEISQEAMG